MAQTPQVRVVQALNLPRQKRRLRRPVHRFNVKAKPFEICPTVIAPVLPGETMTNCLLQARAVSDPIKEPLVGWHYEHYLFYVSMPALASTLNDQAFVNLFIDSAEDASDYQTLSNSVPYYSFKGGIDWVPLLLDFVTKRYFRDEGDETNQHLIENYPAAYIDDANIFNSVIQAGDVVTNDDAELPYVDEVEDVDPTVAGFTDHRAAWESMRDMGLTTVTFEDYLAAQGVNVPQGTVDDSGDELHDELSAVVPGGSETIRFARDWTYPTNHVDPATGVPSSAVSWSIAERADKKRFFKYPGFIFGCCVVRPKIYLGNQKGVAAGLLRNAQTWLPAVLQGYPYASLLKGLDLTEGATTGILQNQTDDYWLDIKDLFLHGDQFVNHTSTNGHAFAMPTTDPALRAPTEAMIDALFVTAGSEYIRQDGVARFTILGRLKETTP